MTTGRTVVPAMTIGHAVVLGWAIGMLWLTIGRAVVLRIDSHWLVCTWWLVQMTLRKWKGTRNQEKSMKFTNHILLQLIPISFWRYKFKTLWANSWIRNNLQTLLSPTRFASANPHPRSLLATLSQWFRRLTSTYRRLSIYSRST